MDKDHALEQHDRHTDALKAEIKERAKELHNKDVQIGNRETKIAALKKKT